MVMSNSSLSKRVVSFTIVSFVTSILPVLRYSMPSLQYVLLLFFLTVFPICIGVFIIWVQPVSKRVVSVTVVSFRYTCPLYTRLS